MASETSAKPGSAPDNPTNSATYAINQHIADSLRDYANLLVSQGREASARARTIMPPISWPLLAGQPTKFSPAKGVLV